MGFMGCRDSRVVTGLAPEAWGLGFAVQGSGVRFRV